MEEWKEYKLGDLYDVHNGLSKGGKFFGSGYPFLSFKTVFNNYFLPAILPDLVQSNEKEQKGYDIKRGDVFVTRTSETPEELGMSSIALKDYPSATYNGFTKRLRPQNTSLVYPEFIGYYLRSSKFRALFYGLASSMSTRASLANGDLLGMRVFLPSYDTQERIANILKSLDDKIEVNRRINDNLEQQAQALFKSWFVDFEPFRDQPFVESELGMIPEGWRVGTLNELGDIVGGSTPSKAKPEYYTNNGIAWLTPKDLSISQRKFTSKGEIDITQEGYDSCSTKLMPKGSVLFSSRAPIGYITIAKNDICTNQGFKSVIPKLAGTAFLYCFLKESTQEIENKATGSTFKEASGALMKSLPVIIPEKSILDDFESLLSPLFYQQEVVEEENSLLSSLRDTLLPRLMSGEIKVDEK